MAKEVAMVEAVAVAEDDSYRLLPNESRRYRRTMRTCRRTLCTCSTCRRAQIYS